MLKAEDSRRIFGRRSRNLVSSDSFHRCQKERIFLPRIAQREWFAKCGIEENVNEREGAKRKDAAAQLPACKVAHVVRFYPSRFNFNHKGEQEGKIDWIGLTTLILFPLWIYIIHQFVIP